MKYDVEATLIAHEAQLNNLTEVIRELKNEVKKMTQYVDESERECSNYTDTLEEELDTTRERVKKQSTLIDLFLDSSQKLKDDVYILKQKVSANECNIAYLAEIIDDIE